MKQKQKHELAGNNPKPDDERVFKSLQRATERTRISSQMIADIRMLSLMHPFKDEIEVKCLQRLRSAASTILGALVEQENTKRNEWARICESDPCAETAMKGDGE